MQNTVENGNTPQTPTTSGTPQVSNLNKLVVVSFLTKLTKNIDNLRDELDLLHEVIHIVDDFRSDVINEILRQLDEKEVSNG